MTSPVDVARIEAALAGWLTNTDTTDQQRIRAGDIGEGQREYEFEPITDPGVSEPIHVPVEPQPKREPVPA